MRKEKTLYIYPQNTESDNPYLGNLYDSLSAHFNVVNKDRFRKSLVYLLFHKVDVAYFNWVEFFVAGRFGRMKLMLFCFLIKLLRYRRTKIVFLLHNKEPHDKTNKYGKRSNQIIIKHAHVLLTHSSEGLELFGNYGKERAFYPHPIILNEKYLTKDIPKEIDILLWGTVRPYKGIPNFLKQLKRNNLLTKYRIYIAGMILDPALNDIKEAFNSDNIKIVDKHHSFEEINRLIIRSKIVLLTHQDRSVLSSGVLIDTLAAGGCVLAPNVAAFKDMKEEGLAYTYNDEGDMFIKIDQILASKDRAFFEAKLRDFANENSWGKYGHKIVRLLDNVDVF